MLSVRDQVKVQIQIENIFQYIPTLTKETKPILKSLGRTLAENIFALEALPPFDYATCDGYAIHSNMTIGASKNNPIYFPVSGEVCAGALFKGEMKRNWAVNIMTGAPIPEGADCVVPLEKINKQDNLLIVRDRVELGLNVRKAGSELAQGSRVMKRGTIISPLEIGVLASLGRKSVQVIRRPKVSILATGDEIIPIGRKKNKVQVFNSNAYTIASLVSTYGGNPHLLDIVPDDKNKLRESILRCFGSDLVITIGGTSNGLKDMISEHGLEEIPFHETFADHKLPLKILRDRENRILPHLALPGKLVGCMIVFEHYGRSILEKMSGKPISNRKFLSATMQNEIINTERANLYARVKLEKKQESYMAWSTGNPDHDLICPNVEANGYVLIPKTVDRVGRGDRVSVLVPGWVTDI